MGNLATHQNRPVGIQENPSVFEDTLYFLPLTPHPQISRRAWQPTPAGPARGALGELAASLPWAFATRPAPTVVAHTPPGNAQVLRLG